jgi:ADP-dependent phosphofructokinase/glucokinase
VSILKKSNKPNSSRKQIRIEGVRDGILILPGGEYRAILEASSINFELMSEAEQDAIIDTYQDFLNSLHSSIQIIVRVRELDIEKYLDDFNSSILGEKKDIYKLQASNYSEFVRSLVTTNKILSRKFYIVLSHSSKDKDFESSREQLQLHIGIVAKGLGKLGMQAQQLPSIEVLDLFYSFYSPEQAKRQPLRQQTMKMLEEAIL